MEASPRNSTFHDDGACASVLVDVHDLEHGTFDVQSTGDSVAIVWHGEGSEPVVIWSTQQLYGTIDASATSWRTTENQQIKVQLKKLDPTAAWLQLEASQEPTSRPAPENPLVERENVKALLTCAQSGDLEGFRAAAQKFSAGDLSGIRDGNGRNALHFAAAAGNADLCQRLVEHWSFDVDAVDDSGETALSLAAGAGHLSCMQALLGAGASTTLSQDDAPQPVHRAASSGSIPCLELLLEKGASVNASSRMGTPLLWAMGSSDEACAAFLLDHGADPNATDESHITPVLLAAATGNEKLLCKLISLGANVNIAVDGGPAPLHVAADAGSVRMVKALLEAGANAEAVDGSNGCRAIDLAATSKARGVVELLLPPTKPAPGQEWSVDALLRDAKPAHQEQCGGCCGHHHHHDHQHQQDPTTSFSDAEVPEADHPDKEKAQQVKRAGDTLFVKGDHQAAADRYSEALRHNTGDAVLWANRSAAYLRTGAYGEALQDARRARTLDKAYAKAFYREGCAAEALQLWEEAAQAYFEAFRLEPNTAAYAQAFHKVMQEARKAHA